MSALARYFKFVEKEVSGYDKTETPLTKSLERDQISVHYSDDMKLVPTSFLDKDHTLVVYTPAVPVSHAEYQYFKENGFVIKKRAEVLGMITKDTFCFAVAGTHGKTTTSSILAHLLKEIGTPITAFLGGISEDFDSNFLLEGTEYSVVEADEFDRSFLHLSPDVACITSTDADHLDIYGNMAELEKSFIDFSKRLKPNGKLLVHNGIPIDGLRYGIEDNSDYSVKNIRIEQGTYIFDLVTPDAVLTGVRFSKPGRHNLLNGLAAIAMAIEAGFPPHSLANALGTFRGVQRRFSYRIKNSDFVFIDDYAHHPTEIDAVHQAIEEMHPGKRTLAIFQPHLFSRTRDFADDFAKSLSKFDGVLLLDIYPAREAPMAGITSEWLLKKMKNTKGKLVQKENLAMEIEAQQPEVLVAMGAGDIGLEIEKLTKKLNHAH
jgi:UDP-N-acetylmuramate--alanine ligase